MHASGEKEYIGQITGRSNKRIRRILVEIHGGWFGKILPLPEVMTIPDFEKYVDHFLSKTKYTLTSVIEYPRIYKGKTNLLSDTVLNHVEAGAEIYAFAVKLPHGTSIKVVVRAVPGTLQSHLYFSPFENEGWTSTVISNGDSAIYTATGQGKVVYAPMMFGMPATDEVSIFENGSSTPKAVKYFEHN